MKSNFLYIKKIFFIIFCAFFLDNLDASEIKIKAKEISTLEEGNIIVGNKEVELQSKMSYKSLQIKFLIIKLRENLLQKVM